jgi:hypothetical protein
VVLIGDAMREELAAIAMGFIGLGYRLAGGAHAAQEAQEEILHSLQPKTSHRCRRARDR